MSRRKRRRARPGTGPERSGTRAAKRRPRGAGLVVWLVTIAVIAALGLRVVRTGRPRRAHGTRTAVAPVPLDSVAAAAQMFEAATLRGDWAEALRWQQRIAAALPRNPLALRQLGQALQNHRNAITLPDGRTRWLLRNSLVRAEWEVRSLALYDSSAAVATTPDDRARAHYWKGRAAAYEGLMVDALAEFEAALAIVPGDSSLIRACGQARKELADER